MAIGELLEPGDERSGWTPRRTSMLFSVPKDKKLQYYRDILPRWRRRYNPRYVGEFDNYGIGRPKKPKTPPPKPFEGNPWDDFTPWSSSS